MNVLKKICGAVLSAAILATALYAAMSVAAVDTSGAKTEEWLYDFKAGSGTENAAPSFLSGTAASTESFNADQWFYNSNSSTNKSYVDQNGLHINLNYVNTVTRDSAGGSWHKKVWLWDADYDSGFTYSEEAPNKDYRWERPSNNGFQKINDGAYAVTVKYRLSSKNTSTGRATIGIAIANYAQNSGQLFQKPLYVLDYQNATEVSSDWTYFTAVFDGKKYSTDSGNYINLAFACDKYTADGTYNIFDIESVRVERYVDANNDEGVVRYKTYIDGGNAFGVDSYKFFSVGDGVRLPDYTPVDTTTDFYKWDVFNEYGTTAVAGYNSATDNTTAYKEISSHAGRWFTPAAGAYTLIVNKIAKPVSGSEAVYGFDLENFFKNKSGLNSNFYSDAIKNNTTYENGELTVTSNGGADDFSAQPSYTGSYTQRFGFYTGAAADTAGTAFTSNGIVLKYGYTYTFKMTYKVTDYNEGTFAGIGLATPVLKKNFWDWTDMSVIKAWTHTANTDGYVTVSCTFTADSHYANRYLGFAFKASGTKFTIKEASVTAMAAKVSDPDAAGGIKNGSATVTSAVSSGKTVLTIDTLADDGYILSAGGISVTYGGKTYKAFKKADAADATFGGTGRQFVCSINDDSIDMAKVSVTVDMHKKGTVDLDIVASSIRSDKGSGEGYISAGLRFRGRIATDDTVSVKNVGMVIVPTAMAGETGVTLDNSKAVFVEVDYSDDAVVYDSTDGYRDYMIVLTGLTKDGKAGDLKATEMSAAMFVELSDGSVVYSDVFATSYNAVEQVYADNGIAAGIDY